MSGASGYVGCEVAHQLTAAGHTVLACVRPGSAARVGALLPDECTVAELDLTNAVELEATLRAFDADAFVHCAAVFRRGLADPDKDMVQPTVAMAEATVRACASLSASAARPCRLVHTSSMAAVRGMGQQPRAGVGFFTSDDVNTVSRRDGPGMEPYQFAKTSADQLTQTLARESGLGLVTLCPSFVFGPPRGPAQHSALSCELVRSWLDGERPVESRLGVDVRDLAAAHVRAVETQSEWGSGPRQLRLIVSHERREPAHVLAQALREHVLEQGGAEAALRAEKIAHDASWVGASTAVGAQEVREDARAALGLPPYRGVAESLVDMARALA